MEWALVIGVYYPLWIDVVGLFCLAIMSATSTEGWHLFAMCLLDVRGCTFWFPLFSCCTPRLACRAHRRATDVLAIYLTCTIASSAACSVVYSNNTYFFKTCTLTISPKDYMESRISACDILVLLYVNCKYRVVGDRSSSWLLVLFCLRSSSFCFLVFNIFCATRYAKP